ncbi:putative ssdna binding protein ssb3 protein [Lasiodiplodia theobromae]|uniref:Replication factor A protein 3 n=2 Tax=Lasiodiplodia TaxID=66739 RepID=A0A5N5D953_9PEZI|nr:Replication factor A protein 3 [Lasiodiplodia theobromae]KAF9630464.1 putative ssdna binding protein ssb3 protein [Lasiodiplodia theobromae]KAK0653508.1 Replication factor A protein 3 [Lasiodiplodia hormozganensis]
MAEQTPRISAPYLEKFTHRTVRILGKVTQLRGEQATIDAGGSINLHLNRDAHLTLNNAVEVIGKVNSDLSVRVLTSTDFGSNIDFTAAEAVVDATHRYKEIFYAED